MWPLGFAHFATKNKQTKTTGNLAINYLFLELWLERSSTAKIG